MEKINRLKTKILIKLSKVDYVILRKAGIEITDDLLLRMIKMRIIKIKLFSIFKRNDRIKTPRSVKPKYNKLNNADLVNSIQWLINDIKWLKHKCYDLQEELKQLKKDRTPEINNENESVIVTGTEQTNNFMFKSNLGIKTHTICGMPAVSSDFQ